jgi:lantibiotic biosynthesis protein
MQTTLQKSVEEKLYLIGDYYLENFKKDFRQNTLGLLGGRSGAILLQSLFWQTTHNDKFKDAIESNVEFLLDKIESSNELLATFSTGLAGIGWLFNYLSEKGIIEIEPDEFLEDFDSTLEVKLLGMLSELDFDILHGAMGLGIYFLKRNRLDLIEKIVLALDAAATRMQNEIVWSRYDQYKLHDHLYDFGLAHGNAGILYFLAKCYKANVLPDKCKQLIYGGLNFFESNIQDIAAVGSFFPGSKLVKEYKRANKPYYSRMAWCYGDAGVLHSLVHVCRWIKDAAMEKKFIVMLEQVATRRADAQTGIQDAGFCHGASGVGYMFLNLFKTTGHQPFLNTAEFWLEKTLALGHHEQEVHGYLFHMGEHGWEVMSNMLSGLGGVSVFYLQYLHKELNSDWNECFFLS